MDLTIFDWNSFGIPIFTSSDHGQSQGFHKCEQQAPSGSLGNTIITVFLTTVLFREKTTFEVVVPNFRFVFI